MLFITLNGRKRDVSIKPYLIDWERKVSGPQKAVKDFLYPYWRHDTVLEEFRLPSARLRLDLLNINRLLIIEVSPAQHQQYNPFFHRGSVAVFQQALKRDLAKEKFAQLNGFTFCELTTEDLEEGLSPELFLTRFGITL